MVLQDRDISKRITPMFYAGDYDTLTEIALFAVFAAWLWVPPGPVHGIFLEIVASALPLAMYVHIVKETPRL